ncbi:hypothetical protein SAMN04487995_4728 [Dyadobacter koreensis]|uniref:Uncharacterized protein n=1 Tax=Dyadobacter koreensis TaxID=408657 RepID=A0A1H6YZS1_9BACT|nr:hypothetical protein [Dyadobacter koreensis]SEJ45304.1 hypothetical protein SAMN04487995_4728 [Dyadobacter koreensis]
MYLNAIQSSFADPFSSGLDSLSDTQLLQDKIVSTTNLLLSFSEDFYTNLNLSVISGEYIREPDFLDNLEVTLQLFSPSYYFDQSVTDDESANQLNNLIISAFKIYSYSLRHYKHFHSNVTRDYNSIETSIRFDTIKNTRFNNMPASLVPVVEQAHEFRTFNIKLAEYDHHISARPNILKELVLLSHNLKERSQESNIIYSILLDKCVFLLQKISYRYKQSEQNFFYAVDFVERELNDEDLDQYFFKDFSLITKLHYDIDSGVSSREFTRTLDTALRNYQNSQNLSYENFHCIVKKYKILNVSETKLIEISDKFTSHFSFQNEEINNFDKRAYEITKNYIFNNRFSVLANIDHIPFRELLKEINNIDFLQQETKVYNYFPYLKVCQHLTKQLDSLLEPSRKSKYDENFEKIVYYLKYLKKFQEILKKNFDWCKNRNFSPYQMPISECTRTVVHDGQQVQVFLASSIVLPIDYERVQKDVATVTSDYIKLETISKVQSSILDDIKKIQDIKETIEKTDKKHIEILSVFAAIVLFVSSNIQVFNKTETIEDALRFMLIFAYILILFIVVIWMITRESAFAIKKIPMIHWILIIGLAISTFCAFLLSKPIVNAIEINARIDSLVDRRLQSTNNDIIKVIPRKKIILTPKEKKQI